MKTKLFLFFSLALGLISCQKNAETASVSSPSENINIRFFILNGKAAYTASFNNKIVIDTSYMSFDFNGLPSISENLQIDKITSDSLNETWEMPWGEQRYVQNNYKSLQLAISETVEPKRTFNVEFRVFNDGFGFRYSFPKQPALDSVIIMDENTQFKLTGNHTCWWAPGDWDIYEHLYTTSRFNEIDAIAKRNHPNLGQTYIPENAVNTPFTLKTDDGIYMAFHEAALVNYAEMTLKIDKDNLLMQSELVGNDTGIKAKLQTPFSTPWRMVLITNKATDLIESRTVLNLNEPNKLGDVSWFKPTKYMGIWWEMHLGKASWDLASGKHGATTQNAKKLIDFASENDIHAILVEGWNTGWEHWIGFEDREGVFDFVTPYPDYNLKEVVEYGKSKGVEVIMHHETSSAPRTYEQQLDTAFSLMQSLGMHSVKTGYVGKIIPKGEYHHGQWMINHYNKVFAEAAKRQIAVDVHEPIKATGLRRTYPNQISREGLRGQEFNAWSTDGGNSTEHLTVVAFTAMLAGPLDYTPGIFNLKLKPYKPNNQVNTTLAHQLALYVVIYSPVQMVADLMENYKSNPAFQFIRDVGVDWEQTKVMSGEPGDFVCIARQERETGNWFVGGITDENERELEIDFSFLETGKKYKAIIYKDAEIAHWDKNPTAYKIESFEADSSLKMKVKLAAGGGFAISLKQ